MRISDWSSDVCSADLLTLLFLIVPHLLYRAAGRPSPMVMAFLNAVGWIAGLRIRTTGTRLRRDVLFVSNHVSWLDILAPGGAARSAFVSKAEIGSAPPVGWPIGRASGRERGCEYV